MSGFYQLPVYQYLTQTLLRHTGLQPEQTDAVDLGGGDGLWVYYLLEQGFNSATLVDSDSQKVQAAAGLLAEKCAPDRWRALTADVAAIPVADGAFNLAVSRSSMHLWPDQSAAWREISRIIRPGGYVFSGRGFGPDLPEDIRQSVKAAKHQQLYGDSNEKHHEPASMSAEELRKLAASVGFTTLAVLPDHKAYWFLAQKNH